MEALHKAIKDRGECRVIEDEDGNVWVWPMQDAPRPIGQIRLEARPTSRGAAEMREACARVAHEAEDHYDALGGEEYGEWIAKQIRALALPADAPKWSSEVPTVAGAYWLRRGSVYRDEVCRVRGDGKNLRCYYHEQGLLVFEKDWPEWWLWHGPIPEPVGE